MLQCLLDISSKKSLCFHFFPYLKALREVRLIHKMSDNKQRAVENIEEKAVFTVYEMRQLLDFSIATLLCTFKNFKQIGFILSTPRGGHFIALVKTKDGFVCKVT